MYIQWSMLLAQLSMCEYPRPFWSSHVNSRGGQGGRPGYKKVPSGPSTASGQTQISWTNYVQNNIYFVQVLPKMSVKDIN